MSSFSQISPTFEQFLLPVLFVQVDDDGSRCFLALLLPAGHKALLQRQEAVHLVAHQQHPSILSPVLHHLGPGRCVPGKQTREKKSRYCSCSSKPRLISCHSQSKCFYDVFMIYNLGLWAPLSVKSLSKDTNYLVLKRENSNLLHCNQ